MRYGFQCKFQAINGKGDALAEILIRASKVVSEAQGCQMYIVSKDLLDADVVWVYEIWDSKEDHENSVSAPEALALIKNAFPLLADPPSQRTELHVVGGIGLS